MGESVRLHLPLLGQDSLVMRPDVGGDFHGGGAVGLAYEFDFLGWCAACRGMRAVSAWMRRVEGQGEEWKRRRRVEGGFWGRKVDGGTY